MAAGFHATRCIEMLLNIPPLAIKDLIALCNVPERIRGMVAQELSQSVLVLPTGYVVEHAWIRLLKKLQANAMHEICLTVWSNVNAVPNPAEFRRHVAGNLKALKLHSRQPDRVRTETALNAYDYKSLKEAIRATRFKGVQRDVVISEYRNAYVDIRNMETRGELFATYDRLWDVHDTKVPGNLTKFHGLVLKAIQYDTPTVNAISHLMSAEKMDVEFALMDMIKENVVQSNDMHIFTLSPPHTCLEGYQAATQRTNRTKRARLHKSSGMISKKARQKIRK